jgi:superfamily I DNA/RNA helicase
MISYCALANKQELWSEISGSAHIDISRLPTESSEAENVLKTIEELIGGSSHFAVDTGRSGQGNASDISFGDIAVLYRVHSVGDSIAEALGRSGIPTQRTARTSILDNKGVRAALACIKLVAEPQNIFHAENLFHIGIPGLSKHSAARIINTLPSGFSDNENIFDWLKRWGELSPAESQAITHFEINIEGVVVALRCKDLPKALEHTALAMGIEEEELQQPHWLPLIEGAASCTNLSEFLATISLGKDTDFYDPRVEGVTLMTLHASKGLEWKVVFIVGCEEGLIPYNEYNKKADLNEERRLLYVGMTRAKQSLFITYAESRKIRGKRVKRYPSPFLTDIPSSIKNIRAPFSWKKARKKVNGLQLELFK